MASLREFVWLLTTVTLFFTFMEGASTLSSSSAQAPDRFLSCQDRFNSDPYRDTCCEAPNGQLYLCEAGKIDIESGQGKRHITSAQVGAAANMAAVSSVIRLLYLEATTTLYQDQQPQQLRVPQVSPNL